MLSMVHSMEYLQYSSFFSIHLLPDVHTVIMEYLNSALFSKSHNTEIMIYYIIIIVFTKCLLDTTYTHYCVQDIYTDGVISILCVPRMLHAHSQFLILVGSGGGSGSSGADEFEDSVDYDELTDSLLASTFLTATPAAQTEACFQSSQLLAVPPNNDISDQLQLSPHVQLDNTSLSLSPPQDEVDSHDTIHDITESDAQTDHKTKSNDNLLKTNGRMPHGAIPSEEQASGLVPGVLEDLCLPGYIVGTTVPPLVDCEPDITYDPLSESTKGELRLYLDQLEETESELGSSVSGRSGRLTPISTPRSLINYFTIFCLITFGVILLLAYILFESSWPSNQLEGLRHSEVVLLVKEVYYNPIRTKLLSLLGYA